MVSLRIEEHSSNFYDDLQPVAKMEPYAADHRTSDLTLLFVIKRHIALRTRLFWLQVLQLCYL
jgi:hypothetical protein